MSDYRIALPLGRGDMAVKTWHDASIQAVPILAVHGWMDNAGTFNQLAPLLKGHRIYALDLAGHGLSDPRPDGMRYHNADFLDDIYAAMQHIAPNDGPLILLGHSLGAGLLMLLAGIFPERIQALIMIDGLGPISADPSNYATDTRAALEGLMSYSSSRKPIATVEQAVTARRQGITGMLSESASRALCERALVEAESGELRWRTDKRLRLNSLMRFSEEQVLACIKAIIAPCLLITGDAGLPNKLGKNKPRYAERLSYFNQLEQASFPGGHHLHLDDCPEQVADAINLFLS